MQVRDCAGTGNHGLGDPVSSHQCSMGAAPYLRARTMPLARALVLATGPGLGHVHVLHGALKTSPGGPGPDRQLPQAHCRSPGCGCPQRCRHGRRPGLSEPCGCLQRRRCGELQRGGSGLCGDRRRGRRWQQGRRRRSAGCRWRAGQRSLVGAARAVAAGRRLGAARSVGGGPLERVPDAGEGAPGARSLGGRGAEALQANSCEQPPTCGQVAGLGRTGCGQHEGVPRAGSMRVHRVQAA